MVAHIPRDRLIKTAVAHNYRRTAAENKVEFEESGWFVARGWPPLEEWAWPELHAGAPYGPEVYDEETGLARPRGFQTAGGTPRWLHRRIREEAARRVGEHGLQEIAMHAIDAIGHLAETMKDKEVDPRVRLDAAKTLLAYQFGSPTAKVEAKINGGAVHVLASAMLMPDGRLSTDPEHQATRGEGRAIEGQIVERSEPGDPGDA